MAGKFLLIGGLVAVGFDPSEIYLLTVSHSGRGVFDTRTWTRVARDPALAYPKDGIAIGIGPIDKLRIPVSELDSDHPICLKSFSGRFALNCDSGGIELVTTDVNADGIAE